MPFVKLDCNMLRSTLWYERLQREIFITALLMAEPIYTDKPMPQIKVRSLDHSGWEVPPSPDVPYGFVAAAGVGIVRHAIVSNKDEDIERGLDALEKLGEPEQSSRTPDFDGRRLVRVDGGYVVLNFGKYRERDYTAAERQRRYRERQKSERNGVTASSNGVTSRKQKQKQIKKKEGANESRPQSVEDWLKELEADKTYAGIDVRREYGKMLNWCKIRKKQATKRRFVNWLNNADKALPLTHAAKSDYKRSMLPPINHKLTDEELAEKRAEVRKLSAQLRDELKK